MSFTELVPGSEPEAAHVSSSAGAPLRRRRAPLRGAIVGLLVGAATTAFVGRADIPGSLLLLTLGGTTLLLPTSRELSRRILIAGCLFLGWIPFLWWFSLPVGRVDLLLGLVLGVLAGWVAARPSLDRLRRLVPRFRWSDGAMVLAAAVATRTYQPLLGMVTPQAALSRFAIGWDHSAHYGIASMINSEGVLISRLTPGQGGEWAYAAYPQGFHAAAATLMEAVLPSGVIAPGADLVAYARSMGMIVLLSVVTVIAGVCSVPSVRARPLLALPGALFVVATVVLGPGGNLVQDGFPNFAVAVALLSCIPVLVICLARPGSPMLLAALGGAAAGVAQNWSLLLSMGALAVVGTLFPWRRTRWPFSVSGWVVGGLITLATLAPLSSTARLMRGQDSVGNIMLINGAGSHIPLLPLILTVAAAVCSCLAVGIRTGRPGMVRRDEAARTAWMVLAPLGGAITAGAIAFIQLQHGLGLIYYFWKYGIALQVLSAVMLAVTVPQLFRAARRHSGARRVAIVVGSLMVSASAVNAYGAAIDGVLPMRPSRGALARAEALRDAESPVPAAQNLLDAAAASAVGAVPPHVLLPFPTSPSFNSMQYAQWYNALTRSWTLRNQHLIEKWPAGGADPTDSAVLIALHILESDPDAVVIIDPQYLAPVRAGVAGTADASRVVCRGPSC